MATTIDFGIDLGTTNSAIALLNGVKADIIKNGLDMDITSSAVYIGKRGNVIVGSGAKSKLEDDRTSEDVYIEFKRRMGGDSMYNFKSAGVTKSPEELSAEVLKSLKGNVQQRLDRDIKAAVITIPAAFEMRQCAATINAAKLSGFTQCPLLQEPVAASLAYGFQADTEKKSFWLVFDFGGGTFDAAVMKAEDGGIQVVNHGGDNFLGGADIDWGIIEKLIIPEIKNSYNLPEFQRENAKWRSAFAKIKRVVEVAKIGLSQSPEAFLDVCTFQDADDNDIELEGLKLTRAQVVEIVEPLIDKAVSKCKSVLAEKNLSISAISKTILVGGPTLAPYFREILSEKLGTSLDHSVDPLTVVAQGAAVFAGSQPLSRTGGGSSAGTFNISLKYDPIGPDDDPSVVGEVVAPSGKSIDGCTVEFVNKNTGWASGKIRINDEGKFTLRLRAEKGSRNLFEINLCDGTGTKLNADPSEIPYTIGGEPPKQITCNDISVEKSNNEVEILVPKGTKYPFTKTNRKFTTTKELRRGQPDTIIIPILEAIGGNAGRLAGHNLHLGDLIIKSEDLGRDLPLGSDVEITIAAECPGSVTVEAFIPLYGETFTVKLEYNRKAAASESDLRREFNKEKERMADIIRRANAQGSESEEMINGFIDEINSKWAAVASVEGAAQIQRAIINIRIVLDDLVESNKIPEKVEEIRGLIEDIEGCSSEMNSAQRSELRDLKSRLPEMEECKSVAKLERLKQDVLTLWRTTYADRFEFWHGCLAYLYQNRNKIPQASEVNKLFDQGAKAIEMRDKETVRRCVIRLWDLSPVGVVEGSQQSANGSGVTV